MSSNVVKFPTARIVTQRYYVDDRPTVREIEVAWRSVTQAIRALQRQERSLLMRLPRGQRGRRTRQLLQPTGPRSMSAEKRQGDTPVKRAAIE